ncbi:MAG: hypothetical protein GY733_06255 [bacterium]|nr:hypothetical protein [bacterium]
MNTAQTEAMEYDFALLTPALGQVAKEGMLSIQPLAGGRNSRVYRIDCGAGEAYVAKIYPDTQGMRDRRGREFAVLRFLWRHGIRCIPEPLATDAARGFSLLRLVEGSPLVAKGVCNGDVETLVDFLLDVDSLKTLPASRALGQASEACLSLESTSEHLRRRLGRLRAAVSKCDTPIHRELRAFLEGAIEPALEDAFAHAAREFAARGIDPTSDMPLAECTLSPSDYGFHNALRTRDGSIVFLDFEHFGLDDPAKMVSDFLLHPALALPHRLRSRFHASMLERHPNGRALAWRVPVVYPLHAIKWCTILLNEFVPEHRDRRSHAAHLIGRSDAALARQLAKARAMFETATLAQEQFPHAA